MAIADTKTGKVYFPPELENATALMVDAGAESFEILNYRPDSSLLIVVGSPNENPRRAGMSYYLWNSGKLHLLRFTPAAKLCSLPTSTQF
ncbi:hypothetical protein J2Y58_003679 [Sphingomonas sp. BE138]|uniref:hypothetical protein n=1 Tax=Sphingomonas sp. BE138 TaxID=2817845 RepID=UPI002867AB4F|nr:hypothetical protein [Sphingomonas sp. BE138]MDR6790299.1 hypothetical protein [Sphingomonas sp. BE138]